MSFEQKYLKYKNKYNSLKNMTGGADPSLQKLHANLADTLDQLDAYIVKIYDINKEILKLADESAQPHAQSLPTQSLPTQSLPTQSLSDDEMTKGRRSRAELEAYVARFFPDKRDHADSIISSIIIHNIPDRHSYQTVASSLTW